MPTAAPQHETVICPVCWNPIPRERWDAFGCCLTPQEREVIR